MRASVTDTKTSRRNPAILTTLVSSLLACALALLLLAPAASADITFGSQGSGAGDLSNPSDLAVDFTTGEVFVADSGNSRVSVFADDGTFLRAFGWGVDTGVAQFEVCTTASGCQAGISGSGAGQIFGQRVNAIAVDNDPDSDSRHAVYLVDLGNFRVQRFTPQGDFVWTIGGGVNQTTGGNICTADSGDTCRAGANSGEPGEFFADGGFRPIVVGVGPDGEVHVADGPNTGSGFANRVQRFTDEGALIDEIPLPELIDNEVKAFAVDYQSGTFYANARNRPVQKYDADGNWLMAFSLPAEALAVNGAGELFLANGSQGGIGGRSAIFRYDSNGAPLPTAYSDGSQEANTSAISPFASPAGDIFVIESSSPARLRHISYLPPGPWILRSAAQFNTSSSGAGTRATGVSNVAATLNARVNPQGEETGVYFEYVDDATYQQSGFDDAIRAPEDPGDDLTIPANTTDFLPEDVSLAIECPDPVGNPQECLIPDTLYHLRAVATNASGTDTGPEATFLTREPFELGDVYATEVGMAEATLHAELNPLGIPATGYFEYVTEAEFQANGFDNAAQAPDVDSGAPPLDFGDAEDELVTRSAQAQGLQLGTAYRYRLVAENTFESRPGPESAFHTYALPDPFDASCPNNEFREDLPSAHLPDCRAYEMVSPIDKNGGDIQTTLYLEDDAFSQDRHSRLDQASRDGDRLTFSSVTSFGGGDSAPYSSQYIARRDPGNGWATENVTPAREDVPFFHPVVYLGAMQYQGFSDDLCNGWVLGNTDLQLADDAIERVPNLYRRQLGGPGCPGPAYQTLTTVAPPSYESDPGIAYYFSGSARPYSLRLEGFAADGSTSLFSAPDKLAPNALSGEARQLYVGGGTTLRLVSVLPDGTPSPGDSAARAVSDDGSRVFFGAGSLQSHPNNFGFSLGSERLYLRLNPTIAQSPISGGECTREDRACTVAVSKSVSAEDPAARFEAADPEGEAALFTVRSGALSGNLYSFDVATKTPTLIAGGLQFFTTVLGTSADLSRAYFVSSHVLDSEPNSQGQEAAAGAANLYLHEDGDTRFVATLRSDIDEFRSIGRTAQVTPDGRHLAFGSNRQLTSYDNIDLNSGEPAMQLFLYEAEADELLCVSCNPSRARSQGARNFSSNVNIRWYISARLPESETPLRLQDPRALSDDGSRFFFESFDALLPQDTNQVKDIYQWQALGTGECETDNFNYFAQNGGCLWLVSTGQSPEDSRFVDASANGENVFFTTDERLWAGDIDDQVDIYNARAGGGIPAPPPLAADCEGEACRGQGTQAPQALGAGTAAFKGRGNPKPDRCASHARAAKRLSGQAKRLRARARRLARTAKRSSDPRRSRAARGTARRLAAAARKRTGAARRQVARAKRCRAASRRVSR